MRVAIPLVLESDLSTSHKLIARVANGESAAYEFGAGETLRTTLESRKGRLSIQAVARNLSTQRNREVITLEGQANSLLPIVNELAKRLDANAVGFSTSSDDALRDFSEAAQSSNAANRIQLLNKAVDLDSSFGLAYVALLESAATEGPAAIQPVLASAEAHRNSFTLVDRARFAAVVTRLTHAPLEDQANALSALLKFTPNNVDALASLGSDRFLQGDSATGTQLFRRALQLSPSNVNLIQQLGQGLIETKQFAQAEQILNNIPSDPLVPPMLAICALFEGDTSRANTIMEKAFSLRPSNDPTTVLFRGNWLAVSGDIPKAIGYLEQANLTDPLTRSIAFTQITIWQVMNKDFAAAKKSARSAFQAGQGRNLVGAIAVLMANGNQSPEQWEQAVATSPAGTNPSAKRLVLGYGLFLNGDYTRAADIWQDILNGSGGTDLGARAMLASSLYGAGRPDDARKILVQPFVPELGDLYAAIPFTEMRKLIRR